MARKSILIINLLIISFFQSLSQAQTLYFPPQTGTAWESLAPASLGFCADRIDSLYNFLEENNTKSFILLKDGKIVLEHYFGTYKQDSIWYWASAGKSLTAFLVGQAQEEGLYDIHDKTSDYLGAGWTSAPPDKEALITIWHQLTMTSGLDDTFTPTPTQPDPNTCTDPACLNYLADAGTRWAYHTGAYRLLQDVIAAASGVTINQFTKSHVLDPTGMKGLWVADVMYGRARDMARFGLLTLAGGVWNGDTLLHDQQYFYDMTHRSQELNKSYGYLWWLNGQESFMVPGLQFVFPGKLIPNAPDDMIAALGKNDQKIHVIPSKGWVVVRQGNAAGFTGSGGNTVPILFDNAMWGYLNQLVCAPTAAGEAADQFFRIFPNPAQNGWQIEVAEQVDRVELFDMQGRLLRSVAGNGNASVWLDATALPEGVFTVKIFAGGAVRWGKVLKSAR
ncbi:MAG: serine hydrolase [Lewinellaceae bacterium]|nr:serine hydrolase [Lewinellaceae bacterium]